MGEKIETVIVLLIIIGLLIFLGVNGSFNGESKTSKSTTANTTAGNNTRVSTARNNTEKVDTSANGEYKNNADNGTYVLLSENANGTYKVIFVDYSPNMILYPVQLDEVEKNGVLLKYVSGFMTEDELQIAVHEGYIHVSENSNLGQEKFGGTYQKVMNLEEASIEKFKAF